jgi:trans-2,3-dihydro-3-hydroxyanthranilate isomerase
MQRRYVTIDVFTDRAFGGNPLAVVLDAGGLSTGQMQAVAREFNYSETTFVLPPADPAHTAEVRIFTPVTELPFAGHPNVGTALVLAARAPTPPDRVVFEEKAGLVSLEIRFSSGAPASAELTAPRLLARGRDADPAEIAAAVGLTAAEVATARHKPTVASVGLAFVFVELASRAALAAVRPDPGRLAALPAAFGSDSVFVYTADAADAECDLHARMFVPFGGVVEDPATGSAAAALVALHASLVPAPEAEVMLRIAQGEDMGRPSLLAARAVRRGGAVVSAHVGGAGVEMMQGTFFLAGEGRTRAAEG